MEFKQKTKQFLLLHCLFPMTNTYSLSNVKSQTTMSLFDIPCRNLDVFLKFSEQTSLVAIFVYDCFQLLLENVLFLHLITWYNNIIDIIIIIIIIIIIVVIVVATTTTTTTTGNRSGHYYHHSHHHSSDNIIININNIIFSISIIINKITIILATALAIPLAILCYYSTI